MAAQAVVRVAGEADTETVKTLYDQVIDTDRGTEHDVLWRRDLHPSDASLEEAIAEGNLILAVDPESGELLGAGIVNSDFACGYEDVSWAVDVPWERVRCLHLFCTHPSARGKGVAKLLLAGVADWARQQGVAAIRLDVFADNVSARGLYEACGYVYAGPGRMSYEDQEVAHLEFAMYELAL